MRAQEESSLPRKLHEGADSDSTDETEREGVRSPSRKAIQRHTRILQKGCLVSNERQPGGPTPRSLVDTPPCRALALSSKKTNQPSQVQNLRHNVASLTVLKGSGSWRNQSAVRGRLEAPGPAQGWGWTAACRLG